jgi:hypothetical protein
MDGLAVVPLMGGRSWSAQPESPPFPRGSRLPDPGSQRSRGPGAARITASASVPMVSGESRRSSNDGDGGDRLPGGRDHRRGDAARIWVVSAVFAGVAARGMCEVAQ